MPTSQSDVGNPSVEVPVSQFLVPVEIDKIYPAHTTISGCSPIMFFDGSVFFSKGVSGYLLEKPTVFSGKG